MSTIFQTRTIAGVPLLLAMPDDAAGPLPAVLWFHGFGVDKETHRKELRQLAEAGFVAVGVDAAGHGARRLPDLDARQAAPHAQALRTMIELAWRTADEVPALVRGLVEEGLADGGRIGVTGVSMGGYVVYAAVLTEPAIRAAVSILGSPEWPEGDSPHRHLDGFRRTALLSVTAERDENVPPAAARELHRRLAEAEPDSAMHRYVELPGAVHLMSEEHWNRAMDETLRWLSLHLR
ncbi:alpha/beta hydrolase family protein [Longimicrobium sp.]|uniref:alpha/beta hydrolase family protein n=1 Tax=Longimicrobium sp. TaxID=2029185 RepID=UPI003B3B4626